MEQCGAFYAPSYPYMLRIKQKTMKDIESINSINFFKINLSFCVEIYFVDACTELLPIFIF